MCMNAYIRISMRSEYVNPNDTKRKPATLKIVMKANSVDTNIVSSLGIIALFTCRIF